MKILICLALLISACVQNTKPTLSSGQPTKTRNALGETKAVIVHFTEGRDILSSADRSRIEDLLIKEKALGEIDKVEVAVWSDKDLPTSKADLPKIDRDLAADRAREIKAFLKSKNVGDIQTFNMAETASGFERLFNTEQAEMRTAMGPDGKVESSREDFLTIKNEGGPSKAVVYVIRREPDIHSGEDSPNY